MVSQSDKRMHILLADETNTQPSADAKFFVYGGLILKTELALPVGFIAMSSPLGSFLAT